jgi:hypothetical protein
MTRTLWIAALVCCSIATSLPAAEVDFSRDIKPILSDNCFVCHGPDESSRQADLRLDTRAGMFEAASGTHVVVPGDAAASELVARVTSGDPSMRMPPPDANKQLTADEIELIRRWVDEGAAYEKHWAFRPPVRPELPTISDAGRRWVRNPIDHFVFARMARDGLEPSPEADGVMLLRRLHLDLTGLPPTIDEIDAFADDTSDAAYSNLVERLLASPHYGERWARKWLDAARYADSDGYEKDMRRTMWFWRDWVIDAYNNDKPYDQFIVEQIAGDMLPGGGQQELIATGFLRNSMVNEEGGTDPEQFRVEGLFDRMDAVGKAILGITTQCAQCHTHKFDPLTHTDYFGMFAFFNNCEETFTTAYTPDEQQRRDEIDARVAEIEAGLKDNTPDWRERLSAWARKQRGDQPEWHVFTPTELPWEGQKFTPLDDGSILSESFAPNVGFSEFSGPVATKEIAGLRIELLTHPRLPGGGPGRSIYGTGALTELHVFVTSAENPDARREIKLVRATADVNPPRQKLGAPFYNPNRKDGDQRITGPVDYAIDGDISTAWTTDSGPATRNQSRKAVFLPERPIELAVGEVLTLHLDQSHGGPNSDQRQNNLMGRYRFSLTTSAAPVADPLPARVRELVEQKELDDWSDADFETAFAYWRTTVDKWAGANQEIDQLLADYPAGEQQLVIQERAEPRVTHRLERGDFLSPAEVVAPHVPELLHPLADDQPANRLGFARWLVDGRSPTAARAVVNRVWQAYFGTGLVETPEDFGAQSPPPSHPELLDWLAVEFMDHGWSQKHLHRLITDSATYRQSSRVTPRLLAVDPNNRLLARAPRLRVDAEIVRDIALAASGLLDNRVGGASVYPPAPEFLFEPPASFGKKFWRTTTGPAVHRRSLYVHAYRTAAYPPLEAFDAPKGLSSCVRRARSNTPLQALVVLNEAQFVECAEALAERVCDEAPHDDTARIRRAMRLCLAREPADDELAILEELLAKSRERVDERQAWTLVCRAILNLDETITKQ